MGIEKEVGILCLRAGAGVGTNQYRNIALGLGYQFRSNPQMQIDYAIIYPLSGVEKDTYGNHRVS